MTRSVRARVLGGLLIACGACSNPRPRPADALAVRLDIARRALESAELAYERGRAWSSGGDQVTERKALREALEAAQLSTLYAEYAIDEHARGDARAWNALRACLAHDLRSVGEQLAALQLPTPPGLAEVVEVPPAERCGLDLAGASVLYLQRAQAEAPDARR